MLANEEERRECLAREESRRKEDHTEGKQAAALGTSYCMLMPLVWQYCAGVAKDTVDQPREHSSYFLESPSARRRPEEFMQCTRVEEEETEIILYPKIWSKIAHLRQNYHTTSKIGNAAVKAKGH